VTWCHTFNTFPITGKVENVGNKTWDDPEDVKYLNSLPDREKSYTVVPAPFL